MLSIISYTAFITYNTHTRTHIHTRTHTQNKEKVIEERLLALKSNPYFLTNHIIGIIKGNYSYK